MFLKSTSYKVTSVVFHGMSPDTRFLTCGWASCAYMNSWNLKFVFNEHRVWLLKTVYIFQKITGLSWIFTHPHLIVKTLRLEKTSKIIQPNHQPINTMPANHGPQCHTSTFLDHHLTNLTINTSTNPYQGHLNKSLNFTSESLCSGVTPPRSPATQAGAATVSF